MVALGFRMSILYISVTVFQKVQLMSQRIGTSMKNLPGGAGRPEKRNGLLQDVGIFRAFPRESRISKVSVSGRWQIGCVQQIEVFDDPRW